MDVWEGLDQARPALRSAVMEGEAQAFAVMEAFVKCIGRDGANLSGSLSCGPGE